MLKVLPNFINHDNYCRAIQGEWRTTPQGATIIRYCHKDEDRSLKIEFTRKY